MFDSMKTTLTRAMCHQPNRRINCVPLISCPIPTALVSTVLFGGSPGSDCCCAACVSGCGVGCVAGGLTLVLIALVRIYRNPGKYTLSDSHPPLGIDTEQFLTEEGKNLLSTDIYKNLRCSWTNKLMRDPVRLSNSSSSADYVFERAAIEDHFRNHHYNPCNNEVVDDKTLVPDELRRGEVQRFIARYTIPEGQEGMEGPEEFDEPQEQELEGGNPYGDQNGHCARGIPDNSQQEGSNAASVEEEQIEIVDPFRPDLPQFGRGP